MKLRLIIGAISISGASLALACSSTNTITDFGEDAGSSGTSGKLPGTSGGTSGSSGSSGSSGVVAPTNTKLKVGKSGGIIGVTSDAAPHVIYDVVNGANLDLEAAPVAGGAAVVLQASIGDNDFAFVSGGAVAWYTNTDVAQTGIATAVNVWTKTNGKKTVPGATRSAFFAASADGTLVSFSTNATATSTDIAITTSVNPFVATPALAGANAVN